VYDSGDYEKALDRALENANWAELKKQRDAARAQGRLVGLGLAMYVEVCGIGPSSSLPTGGWEHSQVTVERDGHISATTGASPHGQGNETTFAQMLADQPMAAPLQPGNLGAQHLGIAAVPAVRDEQHHGTAAQHAAHPALMKVPDRRADARAARPVGHRPGHSPGRFANPPGAQLPVMRVSSVENRNASSAGESIPACTGHSVCTRAGSASPGLDPAFLAEALRPACIRQKPSNTRSKTAS